MARVIGVQTNPWGAVGGYDPQRSDLWVVDFSHALAGITTFTETYQEQFIGANPFAQFTLPTFNAFFAQSVDFPEMKVNAKEVMRDSRPYMMPDYDAPMGTVKIDFILESTNGVQGVRDSEIYRFLELWRAAVRSGRGSMSNEIVPPLNSHYRQRYRWDVAVRFLRGGDNPALAVQQQPAPSPVNGLQSVGQIPGTQAVNANRSISINNDLRFSTAYSFINTWLTSIQISPVSYVGGADMVKITAVFHCEDVYRGIR